MPQQRPFAARGRAILAGLSLAVAAAAAAAEPSVPWTPSAAGRHALQLLADDGGLALPLSQWPLPRDAVSRALDELPRELPPALDAARARVAAELREADAGAVALAVRNRDEGLAGFGDDATVGHSLAARTPTVAGPRVAARLGARFDRDAAPTRQGRRVRFEDSALAVEALGVQAHAWSQRFWWGPGWQSSLILGHNAPAFNGVGLQRAAATPSRSPWLAWMGPWNLDLFVAQADDSLHSYLVGTRLTLRPWPLLELGVSRTAQWGGEGRPQTVESFLRMLVGKGTNPATEAELATDPGNGIAGFDARLRCPGGRRCAAYAQLIGEDQAGVLPSRYLGLYGAETWSADGRHRWFAEFLESVCGAPLSRRATKGCAYRNQAYPEGYSHATRWIGAAAGADARLLTLGWLDARRDLSLRLHAGSLGARLGVFTPQVEDPEHSGALLGLGARRSWTWGPATLGAELDWLRIGTPSGARHEGRVGLTMRLPFGRTPGA